MSTSSTYTCRWIVNLFDEEDRMDSVAMLNDSGIVLTEANRPFEAIELFRKALVQEPENQWLWLNIGMAQKKVGDYEAAEYSYRRCVGIDRSNGEAWSALGLIMYEQERFDEAERFYLNALDRARGIASIYNNYGVLKFTLGDYNTARELFEQAVALSPGYHDALYNLRDCCMELEDPSAAYEIGRRLNELGPNRGRQASGAIRL
jgi:tetratricopeptide (TPR) repeat protein